jgi:hypothetical protein|tara:strand:- start:1834 stop:2001 length:168 start_codon:yes stop_codon:yes gene_type:complete
MKKKIIYNKIEKRKFVTEDTYKLMFGNEPPTFGKSASSYFKPRQSVKIINGKSII